ncbi:putative dehydrogenase [Klebsiella pneumoniae]|nr:putative dehydrogenase [Klebsiella pneumoniae]
MTIAFIGFGEAGGILAADLAREHAVTIWDGKLNGPEREAMGKKARDSARSGGKFAGAGAGGGHAGFFYCDRR